MRTATLAVLVFAFLISFLAGAPGADAADVVKIGDITSYTGDVLVRSKGAWGRLSNVPFAVFSTDKVVTRRGRAEIGFVDGGILRMDVDSSVSITQRVESEGLIFKKKVNVRQINVLVGDIYFRVNVQKGSGLRYKVRSPSMTAAVRGSDLRMTVGGEGVTYYALISGAIDTAGKFIAHFNPRPMTEGDMKAPASKIPLATNRSEAEAFTRAAAAARAAETAAESQRAGAFDAPRLLMQAQLASAQELLVEARAFGSSVKVAEAAVAAINASLARISKMLQSAQKLQQSLRGASPMAARAINSALQTMKLAASAEVSSMLARITAGVASMTGDDQMLKLAQAQAAKAEAAAARAAGRLDIVTTLARTARTGSAAEAEAAAIAASAVEGATMADSAAAYAYVNVALQALSGDTFAQSAAQAAENLAASLANNANVALNRALEAAREGDLDAAREAAEAAASAGRRATEESGVIRILEPVEEPPDTREQQPGSPSG